MKTVSSDLVINYLLTSRDGVRDENLLVYFYPQTFLELTASQGFTWLQKLTPRTLTEEELRTGEHKVSIIFQTF